MGFPLLDLFDIGGKIIDRVLPDKAANDAAKAELLKMQLAGELDQISQQIKTNQVEAANASVFVAGWRPFIGWICGLAIAVDYILRPLFIWFGNETHHAADFPNLDLSELMPLIVGMLGFTVAHTWQETQKGK